jgi:octaprenyl-diphosphate synthase
MSILNPIYRPISTQMSQVESIIENVLHDEKSSAILEINNHLLNSRGKRLRPALTLLSYFAHQKTQETLDASKLQNIDGSGTGKLNSSLGEESAIKIAAAIELIHLASLIHDDINDEAPIRHNQPSIQAKWGVPTGVTMGVYLYSKSLQLISEVANVEVLEVISNAVTKLCQGELGQILERDNMQLDIPTYITFLQEKTAVLFEAACKCGAILAGTNSKHKEKIGEYGTHLGTVFQIADDILDIMGDETQLKKEAGQDFEQGEFTLPILMLLDESQHSESDKAEMEVLLTNRNSESLQIIRKKIKDNNIPKKAETIAFEMLDKAADNVKQLNKSVFQKSLITLTDFVKKRGFS